MWTLTRWCNDLRYVHKTREEPKGNVTGLYTYGSPKVGGKLFVWGIDELDHYRFVNNNIWLQDYHYGLWAITSWKLDIHKSLW